jgi:hypothetical protein
MTTVPVPVTPLRCGRVPVPVTRPRGEGSCRGHGD